MANKRLGNATFVKYGYGQVEDNHLSAPRNGQVYGQLPAASNIELLENGQFVRYDKAAGLCVLPGDKVKYDGETETDSVAPIMMVFNEVKIYRDRETDADFAMLKSDYNARIFSPIGQDTSALRTVLDFTGEANREGDRSIPYVQSIGTYTYPAAMPEGTKMVPRVFVMSAGDIYTTNTIMADAGSLAKGDILYVGADGYLAKVPNGRPIASFNGPLFQVVKVYTMPDMQPGVQLQCIKA